MCDVHCIEFNISQYTHSELPTIPYQYQNDAFVSTIHNGWLLNGSIPISSPNAFYTKIYVRYRFNSRTPKISIVDCGLIQRCFFPRFSTHLHLKRFWWPHGLAQIFWHPTTIPQHNTIKFIAMCTSSSQSRRKMFPFRCNSFSLSSHFALMPICTRPP